MWLRSSIYERVPQFWMLIGLAFFAFGLYLGFEYQLIFVYFAVGALSVGRSLWIFSARRLYRAKASDAEEAQHSAEAMETEAEAEVQESEEQHDSAPSY